jgi:hypothetical protein
MGRSCHPDDTFSDAVKNTIDMYVLLSAFVSIESSIIKMPKETFVLELCTYVHTFDEKNTLVLCRHGGQIGRIFAYWAIVSFG